MEKFVRPLADRAIAVVLATRPHFFAFPVGALLAGVAATGHRVAGVRVALGCLIASGGWAVGQLLNDFLDRDADAIEAPERAAVTGELPVIPTLPIAFILGLGLIALLARVRPDGWMLGASSMVLIVTYNAAKALPFVGNLAHGALLSMACFIGAAIADPLAQLSQVALQAEPALLATGLWAAIYVQSNYEKDRAGDAAAGYRTSLSWLTIVQSALLRSLGSLGLLLYVLENFSSTWARLQFSCGTALVIITALRVARDKTQAGALRGYRGSVHGGTLAMLGLGAGSVPSGVLVALTLGAHALTEMAFARTENP